jgi:hypothetical protein
MTQTFPELSIAIPLGLENALAFEVKVQAGEQLLPCVTTVSVW